MIGARIEGGHGACEPSVGAPSRPSRSSCARSRADSARSATCTQTQRALHANTRSELTARRVLNLNDNELQATNCECTSEEAEEEGDGDWGRRRRRGRRNESADENPD